MRLISVRALLSNQAHREVVPQRRAFRVRLSWFPTLPNPREVPEQLQGILGRTQKFDNGDPFEDKAPGAEVSTAEQSEASEPTKPKEAPELLAEALKSVIKKPDDDDKPKAKEAETVKLPDFPNPETYRSWKITVREAARAASDKPDEAFKWVQRSL